MITIYHSAVEAVVIPIVDSSFDEDGLIQSTRHLSLQLLELVTVLRHSLENY